MSLLTPRRGLVVVCALLVSMGVALPAFAANFKLAYWNIKSGKGAIALPGHPATFADTNNCIDTTLPRNAWGVGMVQQELVDKIKNDPEIVALGLAEAWTTTCASPETVRSVLGWAARTNEQNGVAVVARYGFAGPATWTELDTSLTSNPSDTMWIVRTPICLDPACTTSFNMFTAHWGGSSKPEIDIQAQQTRDAMAAAIAGSVPHVVVGDLNVWEGTTSVCNQLPQNTALGYLRDAGYFDGWMWANGSVEGYTGMANRAGCGVPEGYTWKRVDYAWSKNILPLTMTRFGMRTPGDASPSDHYGIIVEYAQPTPTTDVTPPTASISSPAPNAAVSGNVIVSVAAVDDIGVARVDLLLDGVVVGSATTSPYQIAWDTTRVVNGVHVLQARALDATGNAGSSASVSVTVNNTITVAPSSGDVVLYAAHAATVVGTWQVASDASAAGGARLWNANAGAAKQTTALTAPASYFEMSFPATAGVPYRLWIRGRAESDSWANDSVFVQFSGSVTSSGGATYRIGTTSGAEMNLEDCSGCGLAGWGWQDNGWGVGVFGPLLYFAQTGTQTLRIQPREDGLSIDQIVLSPQTYLNTSPGALKNDTVILPESSSTAPPPLPPPPPPAGGCSTASFVPTCYNAITDLAVRTKPSTPAPAAAGSATTDTAFGSRILRVTDGSTRPAASGRSYRSPSGTHQNAWSLGGKYFYVVSTDGTVIPFAFDPSTMKASRIQPSATGDGGLTLKLWGEPQFSFVSDSTIYGIYSGANLRTLSAYDFTTGTYSTILNLDTVVSGLSGTYVGGVSSSGGSVERLAVFFGGTSQDQHYYAVVVDRANPASSRLLNTMASTVDGAATNITLNFHLHHMFIDKSGRYVMLYPTSVDRQAPRSAAPAYLWDLSTNQFTAITRLPMGHDALGYGYYTNQDCCTSSTWDAAQWQLRSFTAPQTTRDLIAPILTPKEIQLADHQSWTNAQAAALVPVISGTFRYGVNTTAWRPLDDEIIAIQTDLAAGAGATVWRFAHHRSNVANDNDATGAYFWYMPRPIVSQDGRWALYTSNWDKTLGNDPGGEPGGLFRQDAFIVELQAPGATTVALLQITTTSVAAATVNASYSATLQSSGGAAPIRWSIAPGGALPEGLSLDPTTGTISGVPAHWGTTTFAVQASDSSVPALTASQSMTLTVAPTPLTIATTTLSGAIYQQPYSAALVTNGGTGAENWSLVSGQLPPGVTLNANGMIAGTPAVVGTFTFTVQVADTGWPGYVATQSLNIAVHAREIVLYASDASKLAGTWSLVPDATAAGGVRIWNPDKGAAKQSTPLANPPNYFEVTFQAEAGVAYHIWLRGQADNNYWGNDSIFVQFSGSVDATGAPIYRIGTSAGAAVNLEDCSGCGESGWGWQDNGWGVNVFGPNIFFAESGPQTLRVQIREDGFSIDQIVLSADKYRASAPGALKNDTTILQR